MKKDDLLFVYGTLRVGQSADLSDGRYSDGVEYVDSDVINGKIFDLGWFPGAKVTPGHFDTGAPSIIGDVFRLTDDAIIPRLDGYEGYPNLYDRVQTETASGRHVWVYVYNAHIPEERQIVSGDWLLKENNGMPSAA